MKPRPPYRLFFAPDADRMPGPPLVLCYEPGDKPILTVANASKNHKLYLVRPAIGEAEPEVGEITETSPGFPNTPTDLVRWAYAQGWQVDQTSLQVIVGRYNGTLWDV